MENHFDFKTQKNIESDFGLKVVLDAKISDFGQTIDQFEDLIFFRP